MTMVLGIPLLLGYLWLLKHACPVQCRCRYCAASAEVQRVTPTQTKG